MSTDPSGGLTLLTPPNSPPGGPIALPVTPFPACPSRGPAGGAEMRSTLRCFITTALRYLLGASCSNSPENASASLFRTREMQRRACQSDNP
jgi:hypothetical protein